MPTVRVEMLRLSSFFFAALKCILVPASIVVRRPSSFDPLHHRHHVGRMPFPSPLSTGSSAPPASTSPLTLDWHALPSSHPFGTIAVDHIGVAVYPANRTDPIRLITPIRNASKP